MTPSSQKTSNFFSLREDCFEKIRRHVDKDSIKNDLFVIRLRKKYTREIANCNCVPQRKESNLVLICQYDSQ